MKKPNINDLTQCESCEGYFDPEKTISNGENWFCENCHDTILQEVRQIGIDNLDEYLSSRNLKEDFHVFSSAKFSGITEEEYKDQES